MKKQWDASSAVGIQWHAKRGGLCNAWVMGKGMTEREGACQDAGAGVVIMALQRRKYDAHG